MSSILVLSALVGPYCTAAQGMLSRAAAYYTMGRAACCNDIVLWAPRGRALLLRRCVVAGRCGDRVDNDERDARQSRGRESWVQSRVLAGNGVVDGRMTGGKPSPCLGEPRGDWTLCAAHRAILGCRGLGKNGESTQHGAGQGRFGSVMRSDEEARDPVKRVDEIVSLTGRQGRGRGVKCAA